MQLPEFPVEGGCQCGQLRYRLKASPLGVYNCHCKDCQRFSGAAWSMSAVVRRGDFELIAGTSETYLNTADSGRQVAMHSCPKCHTRVWNEPLAATDIYVLRAGTLDDMDWAVPIGSIWTDSKAAWVEIDPAQVNFPGQAPSREPLYAAWTALTHKDS
ncbi:GFA family protein [Devosia sp.]|uniref:GFA family protein n=1 Tax=Devosia sp. TaxID=1871048 RepID=UPI003264F3A1